MAGGLLDLGVGFGFKPFLHGASFGSELCFGLFQTLELEFSMLETWIFYSGRLSFFVLWARFMLPTLQKAHIRL